MFDNLNKTQQKSVDKNFKMMVLSSSVLVGLFIYTSIKSDHAIQGSSYYIGLAFLFVLLIIAFSLQKFRDKLQKKFSNNKFQELVEEDSTSSSNIVEKVDDIKPTKSDITFDDVAGIESIKEELEEVVDFLNNPSKYSKYNVSLPKGVLLVGPPGVGKTLIAKAVANEADVPFFYQSGSSFVNIYVGAGAKKVRELFTVAKYYAPSIVFIDEIDAIGKTRGVGNNEEREATLNELLTQMDGFSSSDGVMVIAATNKIEVLDEALLRAGRFDRRVFLTLPNKDDRKKILNLYLKDVKKDFDIEKLANDTSGFSSSALATLVNEALLYMIKQNKKIVTDEEIEYAKQKIQFGKKQLQLLSKEQKDILATYQAAKAFSSKSKVCLFDSNSIVKDDITFASKSELKNRIKVLLIGKITLEIFYSESYAIFPEDIKKAYDIADMMVKIYKMELSVENIINDIITELNKEIVENKQIILDLKNKLLEDEVVVF